MADRLFHEWRRLSSNELLGHTDVTDFDTDERAQAYQNAIDTIAVSDDTDRCIVAVWRDESYLDRSPAVEVPPPAVQPVADEPPAESSGEPAA